MHISYWSSPGTVVWVNKKKREDKYKYSREQLMPVEMIAMSNMQSGASSRLINHTDGGDANTGSS